MVELDRGCFACMLGGVERNTLFLVVTEWRGTANTTGGERTGRRRHSGTSTDSSSKISSGTSSSSSQSVDCIAESTILSSGP